MSYFTDIFRLERSSWQILLGVALLIAAAAGLILWYGPKYDKPAQSPSSKTAPFKLLGRNGTITVTCKCPPYLVAQQTTQVTFNAVIKLEPAAGPTLNVGPRAPSPSASTPQQVQINLWAVPSKNAGFDSQGQFVATDADVISKPETNGEPMSVPLKPQDLDSSEMAIELYRTGIRTNSEINERLVHVDFGMPVRMRFYQALKPVLDVALIFVVALVLSYSMVRKYRMVQEQEEQRLQAARMKARDNPDQASPAWELAGANLEKYFARNLSQVRQVFYVSVLVMVAGFVFVLYGVYKQVQFTSQYPAVASTIIPPAWIASISGLITQFIGATFMVIYRSTMAQANEFVTVLDRINTVGIAMKVLDQIPDADRTKNSAREHLISLLLTQNARLPAAAGGGTSKRKRDDEGTSEKAPESEKE